MRTRVKICGITRPQDGQAAVEYGADAIGLVFFEESPRTVDIEAARTIIHAVPAFVTITALFVNPSREYVQTVLDEVSIDLLQFHGAETPQFCSGFGRRYIKALKIKEKTDLVGEIQQYSDAAGILLDTDHPELAGGSGETFDWGGIPAKLDLPLILAGGLTPENVGDAIVQIRPYAVDVSSGVEQEKGIKDSQKIEVFMKEVRRV